MRKRIIIDFIPQSEQRYDTVGDYGETDDQVWFKITEFDKPAYSQAVLIHELVEKFRNDQLGITDESVTQFDLNNKHLKDPGCDADSPYHKTHMEADVFERQYVINSGEDWADYESAIEELFLGTSGQ